MNKSFHKLLVPWLMIELQEFVTVRKETQQFRGKFPVYGTYDANKANIFFLHGLGASHHSFALMQNALQSVPQPIDEVANILSFDFLGFGGNRLPAEVTISFLLLARQLKCCVERFPARQHYIVAHSMGGALALYALNALPELPISGLFNIEGNIFGRDCSYSRKVSRYTVEAYKTEKFPQLLKQVKYQADKKTPVALVNKDWLIGLQACMPEALHACATEMVGLCDAGDLAAIAKRLQLPHRYLFGSETLQGECRKSFDELQSFGVEIKVVEGAGHCPMLEVPQVTAQLLGDFLLMNLNRGKSS